MACESGIGKIESQTRLLKLIAQLSCEIADAGGGGGGTPGGAPGDLQFNNAGAFGGFGDFNSGTGILTIPGDLLFATDNADDIGALAATRPRTGYFGTSVVSPLFTGNLTGNVTGSSSLNVLKAGDTMTGLLTIAQATANTSALAVTGYSLTGANAQSMVSLAGTWNTSGTPTAIDLNITNTTSNVSSKLLDLRVGGASMIAVRKDGILTTAAGFVLNAGSINWLSLGGIAMPANGTFQMFTNSFAANAQLVVDATHVIAQQNSTNAQTFRVYRTFTNSTNYERLALQTTAGQVIVAAETAGTGTDNIDLLLTAAGTGLVNFTTGMTRLGAAFTVATLPAAGTQGRIAYVTDSLAPAFLTTVVGGGAIVTTVFDNGTNWVAV